MVTACNLSRRFKTLSDPSKRILLKQLNFSLNLKFRWSHVMSNMATFRPTKALWPYFNLISLDFSLDLSFWCPSYSMLDFVIPFLFWYPEHAVSLFNHESAQKLIFTVARTPSSCRPPWLETAIAETPCWTASSASSARKMPLTTIGNEVMLKTKNGTYQSSESTWAEPFKSGQKIWRNISKVASSWNSWDSGNVFELETPGIQLNQTISEMIIHSSCQLNP